MLHLFFMKDPKRPPETISKKEKECCIMKKLSLFLTAGLIAGCMAFPAAAEEDKTWVIATDTVFKPFEYTDERSGMMIFVVCFKVLCKLLDSCCKNCNLNLR